MYGAIHEGSSILYSSNMLSAEWLPYFFTGRMPVM